MKRGTGTASAENSGQRSAGEWPFSPLLTTALATAQTQAAALLKSLSTQLEGGMSAADIAARTQSLAQVQGLGLAFAPRVHIGTYAGMYRIAVGQPPRLSGPVLVQVDVQVRVHVAHAGQEPPIQVAGDFARTLIFGDSGRLWFYRRKALQIYAAYLAALPSCKNERDAYAAARACAHHEGCALLNRPGHLGHHVPVPLPDSPWMAHLKRLKEGIEHPLKAKVPFGLASPPLNRGVWSLEPLFEVDRHVFLFEDLFCFSEGRFQRLGDVGTLDAP